MHMYKSREVYKYLCKISTRARPVVLQLFLDHFGAIGNIDIW